MASRHLPKTRKVHGDTRLMTSPQGRRVQGSGRAAPQTDGALQSVGRGAVMGTEPRCPILSPAPPPSPHHAGTPLTQISISTLGCPHAWRCHLNSVNTGAKCKGHKHSRDSEPIPEKLSEAWPPWELPIKFAHPRWGSRDLKLLIVTTALSALASSALNYPV